MSRALLTLLLAALALGTAQAQSDDLFVIGTNTGGIVRATPSGLVTPYAQVNAALGLGAVGFAIDAHGFLYFAAPEQPNPVGERQDAIYRVDSTGAVTVFARGFKQLGMLAFAPDGTLFSATNSIIYKISPSGMVTSMPTSITGPTGMAFAANGTLFMASVTDNAILEVNPATGTFTPFATGLGHPEGLAFDPSGTLFVADIYLNQVKRLSSTGAATVVAQVPLARSLAFGPQGVLYITSENADAVYQLDKTGALTQFITGLDKPLNLAFNHPLVKPLAATPAPNPALSVGLMVACGLPALVLIIGLVVWLLFREKKEKHSDSN
jgi:serine/threonine-protein kinase